MTPFPLQDIAIIAGLILLNGVFAMSELAIVSARTARLEMAEAQGSASARTAIALAADPGKFLSTVQIGITLVAIIAGAFSGAALGEPMGQRLQLLGMSPEVAESAGFALVIMATTYFSVVVGELVPKQLALRAAEPIAMVMARPMAILARVMAPFVWLLDRSSALILRLMSIRKSGDAGLSAEELQMIFAEATRSGAIEEGERAMMAGILKLADRPVRELMTPRTELDWVDLDADEAQFREVLAKTPHSLLPVAEGSSDEVRGVVKVRDVLAQMVDGEPMDLRALMLKPEIVPDQVDALDAMRILQTAEVAMGLVHDEYGHFEGIVTPTDLLTAIAGSFAADRDENDGPHLIEREDGTLLVSGAMAADALAERLDIALPDDREFATLAGHALWMLKHLPSEGEYYEEQGWRFEIVDMDGRRIDKMLLTRVDPHPAGESEAEGVSPE